jgi:hypothetical protein
VRALGVVIGVALIAAGAHGASDCLEPLRANAGWRCHAGLSNGQGVDYCLEHTHTFGADPVSRFFKLVGTGPYTASCSCRAKGNLPGAAFGEDKTYLCLDRATDTVISGKISKPRISGQTFNVGANVRTTFSCEPDPACDVQSVLDPDLPARSGFVDLLPYAVVGVRVTGGGDVDIGGIAGCGGYASEAPNVVFNVEPGPPGHVEIFMPGGDVHPDDPVLLVVTPSGAAHCVPYNLFLPLERGSYSAWVAAPTAGFALGIGVQGAYRLE